MNAEPEPELADLLAASWPVPRAFEPCPIRTALWLVGLQRLPLHPSIANAALSLLDVRRGRPM